MQPWFISLPFLHLVDYAPRECYHSVRFEKESRYYVIRLSKDLLDDWVITLVNGRIKSKLGQTRTLAFNNFNEGFDHLCTLAKTRHQRGYQLKDIFVENYLLLNILSFLTITENNNNLFSTKTGRKRNIQNSKLNTPLRNDLPPSITHLQMDFLF